MERTRLITLDDVPELTDLLSANRRFLAPWEPERNDEYFTVERQRELTQDVLERHERGTVLPHLIVDTSSDLVGRITLSGIVRGPFQSCSVGYWVSETHHGLGVATDALRHIVRIAFDELGLHRVQAESLLHNLASQRVLERCGFDRIGMAPRYLRIAGEWQDNLLFQLLNE